MHTTTVDCFHHYVLVYNTVFTYTNAYCWPQHGIHCLTMHDVCFVAAEVHSKRYVYEATMILFSVSTTALCIDTVHCGFIFSYIVWSGYRGSLSIVVYS